LWAWSEGVVRAGTADGVETTSFHDHRYAVLVIFCSILLIPEKDGMLDSVRQQWCRRIH